MLQTIHIRTALAHRALDERRELDDLDGRAVERLFRPGQDDPKGDLLKCVTVRDSEPADPDSDEVVLRFPKTRRLVLRDGTPGYPLG
jgi:hypothetical protein